MIDVFGRLIEKFVILDIMSSEMLFFWNVWYSFLCLLIGVVLVICGVFSVLDSDLSWLRYCLIIRMCLFLCFVISFCMVLIFVGVEVVS